MNPTKTICVMNLSYEVTQKTIQSHFSKYGTIKQIKMPLNTRGQPRGIAHIEFEKEDDAHYAMDSENQQTLQGRKMHIAWNKFKRNDLYWSIMEQTKGCSKSATIQLK